jgi:hypothetical protein
MTRVSVPALVSQKSVATGQKRKGGTAELMPPFFT